MVLVSQSSLRSLRGRRRPSSSSPRGEVLAVALVVTASMALSMALSGHALVLLARVAWTPAIIAGALLASLWLSTLRPMLRWAVSGAVLFAAVDTAIQYGTGADLFGVRAFGPRLSGFLPHPNDAALWAVLLPFTPWLLWPVTGALILVSHSRMALAGALVVCVLLAPRAWRWRLGLGLGALFAGLLVVWVQLGHVGQTNGTARLGMWLVGMEMFTGAPWFGQGPARFVDFYLPLLRQLGPHPWGIPAEWAFVPWAHNLGVEVLAERGVLGLLALGLPLLWVWRQGDSRVRAGLAAFLVMGLVDLTFLKPWVVGVYWGLIVLTGEARG
jgi:hypothetical protein